MMTPFLHPYVPPAVVPAFLADIPQGSASALAVALAFLPSAVAYLASAVALASEIGPGFSPDIQPQPRTGALAPGTLLWELP
jgi:hypothetical protein